MKRHGLSRFKRPTVGQTSQSSNDSVWHSTPRSPGEISAHTRGESSIDDFEIEFCTPIENEDVRAILPTQTSQSQPPSSKPSNVPSQSSGIPMSVQPQSIPSQQRHPPVNITESTGHTIFSGVLQQHGYLISKPRNVTRVDTVTFKMNLSDWVQGKGADYADHVEKVDNFIKDMRKYLSDKGNFRHSLTPTRNPEEIYQSSLVNFLLNDVTLQPHVLKIVMPNLAEYSYTADTPEEAEMIIMIMSQMRWIPNLVDPEGFTRDLLELVENANSLAQKELLRFLADVVPEKCHHIIGELLTKLFENGSEAIAALIDCFSCIDIHEEEWEKIREAAFEQFLSAPLSDYPSYFSFILRLEDPDVLSEYIMKMREKLEITPLGDDGKNDAHMIEIYEKVRFCIAVNPKVVAIWTKQLKDDVITGEDAKSLDLLMLLIFGLSYPQVELLVRSIFHKKNLTEKLLNGLLKHNLPIILQVFRTLSNICFAVLRGKDTKAHESVVEIIVKLFLTMSPYEAQDITCNLASILINDYPLARNTVLNILEKLSEVDSKKLLMFSPQLMGILEYVMRFPPAQIRQLMNVLATLAHIDDCAESDRYRMEFSILLRKQLTHVNVHTRCFGILGVIATIQQLSLKTNMKEQKSKIEDILYLAWKLVERDENPCSIFFDEFSKIIDTTPIEICVEFRDIILSKFEMYWTLPAEEINTEKIEGKLRLAVEFDANKEIKRDKVVINMEGRPLGMSNLVIPSHLRLAQLLQKRLNKFDDMDALLGSPILMPDLKLYYSSDSLNACTMAQRSSLGQHLVLALNFFREAISAFISSDDVELKIKIWLRLENVIFLQKIFADNFHLFPNLPCAYVSEKSGVLTAVGRSAQKGRKKKRSNGLELKRKPISATFIEDDEEPTSSNAVATLRTQKSQTQVEEEEIEIDVPTKEDESSSNIENAYLPRFIIPHLRKFDKQVFTMLTAKFSLAPLRVDFTDVLTNITKNANSFIADVESLNIETLIFLLLEMNEQMSDKNSKFNIFGIKGLIQSLCSHLDYLFGTFKKEKVRGKGKKIEGCVKLIFKTLSKCFEEIKGRKGEEKEKFLWKAINSIVKNRHNTQERNVKDTSFSHRIKKLVDYLTSFEADMKDPLCAVEHVKMFKIIYELLDSNDVVGDGLKNICEVYLKRRWKLGSSQIELFLKSWFLTSPELDTIKFVTRSLMPYGSTENETDVVIPFTETFQTCNKSNFHTWYSVLISTLAQHVHKYGKKTIDVEDSKGFWKTAVKIYKSLINVSKLEKKGMVLASLLKYSRIFVEALTLHGIKMLEPRVWSINVQESKNFLKNIQACTRKLHSICEYSKDGRNVRMMRNVPLVKKALEIFLYKMREVLALNGFSNLMNLGSLKHRDLNGKVVSSQAFMPSEDEEEESSKSAEEMEIEIGADEVLFSDNELESENEDSNGAISFTALENPEF